MISTALPLVSSDACCVTDVAGALDADAAVATTTVFKALSDPARVRLLSIVANHPDGEVCVCDLTVPIGLSQPTVSHHMRALTQAGLVLREQRGKWAYFSLAPTARQLVDDATAAVLGAGVTTTV